MASISPIIIAILRSSIDPCIWPASFTPSISFPSSGGPAGSKLSEPVDEVLDLRAPFASVPIPSEVVDGVCFIFELLSVFGLFTTIWTSLYLVTSIIISGVETIDIPGIDELVVPIGTEVFKNLSKLLIPYGL